MIENLVALAFWAIGFLLFRPLRWRDHKENVKEIDDLDIIIPARNEEENLPNLLESLITLNNVDPHQILVVNDSSTDNCRTSLILFDIKNTEEARGCNPVSSHILHPLDLQ